MNRQVLYQYTYKPDKISRRYACEPTLWQDSVLICLRNRPCAGTVLLPSFASHEYYINKVYILPSSITRITTIITPLEESRPASMRLQRQHASITPARVYNASIYLQRQHVPTTPACVYNANILPILCPLKSASICGSYKPLIAPPQLPKGYRSGNYTVTRRPYYINIYNNKAQWEFPTTTTYQK